MKTYENQHWIVTVCSTLVTIMGLTIPLWSHYMELYERSSWLTLKSLYKWLQENELEVYSFHMMPDGKEPKVFATYFMVDDCRVILWNYGGGFSLFNGRERICISTYLPDTPKWGYHKMYNKVEKILLDTAQQELDKQLINNSLTEK